VAGADFTILVKRFAPRPAGRQGSAAFRLLPHHSEECYRDGCTAV